MAAKSFTQGLRLFSSNSAKLAITKNAVGGKSLVEKVAITEDGKTIVAWHPEAPFPYEFSKPIPTAEQVQSSQVIKEEALQTAMRAFKGKHPEIARQELMQLTYTTKHRWFSRSRDKKAKDTPMERPYL